jgi:hypothetical protein
VNRTALDARHVDVHRSAQEIPELGHDLQT